MRHHTSGVPSKAPRASGDDLTLETHVRALAGVELAHRPGTVHEYASPNYQVLGTIVETVSGQTFGAYIDDGAYIDQHIFGPLGMERSFVSRGRRGRPTWRAEASGHHYWFGFPVAGELPEEPDRLPTAALMASAEDLSSYLIAQLNEGRYEQTSIVSPAGMAELHRPAVAIDGETSYAMGWPVGPIAGVSAIHHGGIRPDFRGKMVLLPGTGWGVAVLTNASSVLGDSTSHRIADGVAARLVGQARRGVGLTLGRLSLVVAAVLAIATFNLVKDVATLRRWRTKLLAGAAGRGSTPDVLRGG